MAFNLKSLGYLSFKNHPKPITHTKNHILYISRNTQEHRNEVTLFNVDQDQIDRKDFYKKLESQPRKGVASHKLVFSLSEEERDKLGIDMKELTRETIASYEEKQGYKLDWVAAIHDDQGHPHVHVVIRGRSEEGKEIGIRKKNLNDFRKIGEKTKERLAERNQERGVDQNRDLLQELESERTLFPAPEKSRDKTIKRELAR